MSPSDVCFDATRFDSSKHSILKATESLRGFCLKRVGMIVAGGRDDNDDDDNDDDDDDDDDDNNDDDDNVDAI